MSAHDMGDHSLRCDGTDRAAALQPAMTEERFHLGLFHRSEPPTLGTWWGACRCKPVRVRLASRPIAS